MIWFDIYVGVTVLSPEASVLHREGDGREWENQKWNVDQLDG